MPVVKKQSATHDGAAPKGGGVLSRIAPVQLYAKKDSINVYGVSGTGKTTLGCTYPKPLLLIGAETGTRSVHTVKGVEFVRLQQSGEIAELIEHIRKSKKYATTVLDTATSFQAMVLAEILGLDELPVQRFWGMASRDQYGQAALQTKEVLRHLLRLAEDNLCHAVILAQEREFASESGSELIAPTVMSSLTASTVGWLNPECDYIVQTFIRSKQITKKVTVGEKTKEVSVDTSEIEYCLRTRPHPVYMIKFRGPKGTTMPEAIVDPSYEKIHSLIGD